MGDSERYNQVSCRLWEKLEYHRNKFSDFKFVSGTAFPIDTLSNQYPFALELVRETCEECKYDMSEFQCSWAVWQTFGFPDETFVMENYNKVNGTDLKPRP